MLVIVFSGVCGAGKTVVAEAFSKLTQWPFQDGDTFHSEEAIAKMRQGISLIDEDRWPWLERITAWIQTQSDECVVLTCSALKRSYRDFMRKVCSNTNFFFVELTAPASLLRKRLFERNHFANPKLLETQLEQQETLALTDENGMVLDTSSPVQSLAILVHENVLKLIV